MRIVPALTQFRKIGFICVNASKHVISLVMFEKFQKLIRRTSIVISILIFIEF